MYETIAGELFQKGIKLVAVSKTKSPASILTIYNKGQRIFGENQVQELLRKHEILPKDIQWHMIGHLQRNKVRQIAPFISLIHSVDTLKLIREINKEGLRIGRTIDYLLQIKIAKEESKYGMDIGEAEVMIGNPEFMEMKMARMVGLMGMSTFTTDENQISREFKKLKIFFDKLRSEDFVDSSHFSELSMGMSGDYNLAIEEGTNMVRIGSLIFGPR